MSATLRELPAMHSERGCQRASRALPDETCRSEVTAQSMLRSRSPQPSVRSLESGEGQRRGRVGPHVRERLLRVLLADSALAAAGDLPPGDRVDQLPRVRPRHHCAVLLRPLPHRLLELDADGVLAPPLALPLRADDEAREADDL